MPSIIIEAQNCLSNICINHCTIGRIIGTHYVTSRGGVTLSIDTEGINSIYTIAGKILDARQTIGDNYSQEFLQDKLIDVIFSCHNSPRASLQANLFTQINNLFNQLQLPPQSWVFFIPIVNLGFIDFYKLTIGTVNFYKITVSRIRYFAALYQAKALSDTLKATVNDLLNRGITIMAIIVIEAGEPKKAKDKAVLTVEDSLNILRLYAYGIYTFATQQYYQPVSREEIFWSNLTTNNSGNAYSTLFSNSLMPFNINKQRVKVMRSDSLAVFNKILSKNNPTALESKMLGSLHWFGLAVKDELDVDRFVKLIVSLESLLLEKKEEPKKHLLADRAAFLLGKDKQSREQIFNAVAEAYSLRGDIVHQGRCSFSDAKTAQLFHVLRGLIFKVANLSTKISTLKEISDRIKEIKFEARSKL